MKVLIFSPWLTNDAIASVYVSVAEVEMRHPWAVYAEYDFAWGVDSKLNNIPRHIWGRGQSNEALYRVPRLVHFVDTTGCRPAPHGGQAGIPRSHHPIQTLAHCDHTSYWVGPGDEPLILTEPYWPAIDKIEAEIAARQLNAIVLPPPGIYAGGGNMTNSILMGLPQHARALDLIAQQLARTRWPDSGFVKEMEWLDALELSKRINSQGSKSAAVRS